MGFGGGGSGSFVLPNHTHTNALADGGALPSATTLIDALTIQAYSDAEYTANHVVPAIQKFNLVSNFSTTSNTLVDITSMTITLPNTPNGQCQIACGFFHQINTTAVNSNFALLDDGSIVTQASITSETPAYALYGGLRWNMALDGSVLKCQMRSNGSATVTVLGSTAYYDTSIIALEVA